MIRIAYALDPKVHHVIIEGMKYIPMELNVKTNETIIWHNKDFFPHTVTSQNLLFNSGEIPVNGTWKLILKKPGEFNYKCRLHPIMKGRITVAL